MCQSQETGAQVDCFVFCKTCCHVQKISVSSMGISVALVSIAVSCVSVKSFSVSGGRVID